MGCAFVFSTHQPHASLPTDQWRVQRPPFFKGRSIFHGRRKSWSGIRTKSPKNRDEALDHNAGRPTFAGILRATCWAWARKSNRFFKLLEQPRVSELLAEIEEVRKRWHDQHRTGAAVGILPDAPNADARLRSSGGRKTGGTSSAIVGFKVVNVRLIPHISLVPLASLPVFQKTENSDDSVRILEK